MSEKIVNIDGREVALRCSGATYIKYRNEFKQDLFVELQKFSDTEDDMLPEGAMETLLKATYIMAKQADSNLKDNFEDWLDQFELMGAVSGLQGVFELIMGNNLTLDEAKKNNDQQSEE